MKFIFAVVVSLVFSISAEAHRLDEYLQATRIGLAINRIDIAIDLTPGVAIAQELLVVIEPDGAARISPVHEQRYAQRVLHDLTLEVDGKPQSIKLVRATFPDRAEMEAGEGTIHLQVSANTSPLKPGQHELRFRNGHLPKLSVYLVNALVPKDKRIQIMRQDRDVPQREYRLSFEVKAVSTTAQGSK